MKEKVLRYLASAFRDAAYMCLGYTFFALCLDMAKWTFSAFMWDLVLVFVFGLFLGVLQEIFLELYESFRTVRREI